MSAVLGALFIMDLVFLVLFDFCSFSNKIKWLDAR